MAKPTPKVVGKLGVIVMPDTKQFSSALRKALTGIQKSFNRVPPRLKMDLDDTHFKSELEKLEAIAKAANIKIPVSLDNDHFKAELKKMEALAKANPIKVSAETVEKIRKQKVGTDTPDAPEGDRVEDVVVKYKIDQSTFRAVTAAQNKIKGILGDFKGMSSPFASKTFAANAKGEIEEVFKVIEDRQKDSPLIKRVFAADAAGEIKSVYKTLNELKNPVIPRVFSASAAGEIDEFRVGIDGALKKVSETMSKVKLPDMSMKDFAKHFEDEMHNIGPISFNADVDSATIGKLHKKLTNLVSDFELILPVNKDTQADITEATRLLNKFNDVANAGRGNSAFERENLRKELNAATKDLQDFVRDSKNKYRVEIKAHLDLMDAQAEIDKAPVPKRPKNMLATKLDHRTLDNLFNSFTVVPALITRMSALAVSVTSVGAAATAALVGVTTLASSLKEVAGVAGLLPAAATGLVALGGSLAAAFSGVGTAIAAVHENNAGGGGVVRNAKVQAIQVKQANDIVAKAYDDLADVIEASQQRIVDAERTLDDARRNVNLSSLRAARDVEDAEEQLQKSKEKTLEAEERLNEAREEAVETLEDLSNALANAHLDERKAAIEVRKAYEAYQASLSDPSRSLAAQEELRYEWDRAKQTLIDSKDKVDDLSKENAKSVKSEIAGAKEVVDAQKERAQARDDEVDALRDLQIAREAQTEAAKDAIDRVQLAEQGLADARERQAEDHKDALAQITKAEEAYEMLMHQRTDTASRAEDAMKKLTPSAQKFVLATERMKLKLGEVRDVIQENFFSRMTEPVEDMVNTLLPQLKSGLGGLSAVMGEGWAELATSMKEAMGDGDLEIILNNITEGAREFNAVLKPLTEILTDLSVVGSSFFPQLAKDLAENTQKLADFVREARDNGKLEEWMQKGITGVYNIGRIIAGIAGILGAINNAAKEAGLASNLSSMADALNGAAKVMQGETFQRTMTTIFEGVALLLHNLGPGIRGIGDMFVEIAPDIRRAMGTIGEIGSTVLNIFTTIMRNPAVRKGIQDLLNGIKRGLESVGDRAPQIAETIGSLLTNLGKLIELILPVIADLAVLLGPAIEGIAGAVGNISSFLTPLSGMVAALVALLIPLRGLSLLLKFTSWMRGGKGANGIGELIRKFDGARREAGGLSNMIDNINKKKIAPKTSALKNWATSSVSNVKRVGESFKSSLPNFSGWSKDSIKKIDDVKLNMNPLSKGMGQRGSIQLPKIDTTSVTKGLQGAGAKVGTVMGGVMSKVGPVLGEIGPKILPIMGNVMKIGIRFIPVVGQIIGAIWLLIDVIKLVVDNWDSISKWIGEAGTNIAAGWENFKSQAGTGLETVGGFFAGMWERWSADAAIGVSTIGTTLGNFFGGFGEWVNGAVEGAKDLFLRVGVQWAIGLADGINKMVENVRALPGRIRELVENVGKMFSELWTRVTSDPQRAFNDLLTFFQTFPARLAGFFANAGTWLLDAGKAIIRGLGDGIRQGAPWIADAYEGILKIIDRRTPHSPPKEGPLSGKNWVTYGGRAIPAALAEGIASNAHLVRDASTGMMEQVSTGYTPAQISALKLKQEQGLIDGKARAAGFEGGINQYFDVKEAVSSRATAIEIARLSKVGI